MIEALMPVFNWTGLWMFTTFIFNTIVYMSIPKFNREYKNLKWEMKLDWNIRLTSILNALLCCFYAFKALIYHTTANNIKYFTSGATISLELATGFFMTDFVVIFLLFKHYGKKQCFQFVAHHTVSIIAFSLVLYRKEMIWFANFRLLSELSTPFLNFRWMMQQRGIRDSALYNLNRLVFFGVFALCRIVTIPRYWMTVYNQSEAISNTSPDLIGILFVSGTVLDGLNLFWFYLMFKILISTTTAIKPLMEKKKVEIKIRTQEFHEKMILMKNKNLLKMNKMKADMVEKVQDNIENVRDQVTNSMTDFRTRINSGLRLRRHA